MTKRAINYARVSTGEQADNGYSIPSQLVAGRKYGADNDFEIVAEFAEDYTGAVPIEFRPEGKKVFDLLRSGAADAIIVYTMDRLVRPPEEGDEWDTPVLIRSLAKLGKEIHTVDHGPLKTDFASLLLAMLSAKSAGEERRKIVERTSRGRYAKARDGKVVANGQPPFGYKFSGDNMAIDQTEAEIVRLTYRWYLEEHLSLRAIAHRLNDGGYKTPREGSSWHPYTVMRLLSSDLYIGKYCYGVPSNQNIIVSIPRIVSDSDREAADQIRAYNMQIAQRNRKQTYLLSGMVRCGCGFAMSATKRLEGYIYYRCSRRVSFKKELEPCHERTVRIERVEEIVWQYVYNLMTGDFEETLREAQQAEQARHEPQLAEIRTIDAMLAEVEAEAEQLASAVGSATGIVREKIQRECDDVSKRYGQLKARRDKLVSEMDRTVRLSPGDIETLIQFRDRVFRGLQHATAEDKRKYYEILQVRVMIKDGKIQVSCVLASPSTPSIQSHCSAEV
jgi:site-specific DNA recombinase